MNHGDLISLEGRATPCGDGSSVCLSADEAQLVASAQAGNLDAFGCLVTMHHAAVYRHILRVVRRTEDAEDIGQEAFIKAWRAIGTFRAGAPFAPWILRIASNAAISHLRHRVLPTVPLVGNAPLPPAPALPDGTADAAIAALDAAIADLPADARAAISLHYGEGKSLNEIGSILNRSSGAVAVMLHRVRARLRDMLGSQRAPGRGESE